MRSTHVQVMIKELKDHVHTAAKLDCQYTFLCLFRTLTHYCCLILQKIFNKNKNTK